MTTFLATIFMIICVLLIIVVLLQKGRGGGLGGILGGGGQSAFGTRTGDVFTWVTIVLVGVFLLLAIVATLRFRPKRKQIDTPALIPQPGAIDKPILVTILCRPQTAEIHFTVGPIDKPLPDPTRASLKYDSPVRITPGMMLKAQAYLSGWDDSKVQVGLYPPPTPTTATAPATTSTLPTTAATTTTSTAPSR